MNQIVGDIQIVGYRRIEHQTARAIIKLKVNNLFFGY